jgi:LTXXQ motif family protein
MARTNIAALALLAGVAIAAPTLVCSAADSETQTAQAQTPSSPGAQPPNDQQGQDGMRGMMGREGRGHMGEMRRMMMNRSPKERCEERLARRAGFIAYTVAKLNLTAQQKPLWDKLNASMQSAGDKERQLCDKLPAEAGQQGQGTILDRMSRREQFLQARLQAMQQTRPALEALYNALTPEQKAVVDHPFRR